MQKQLLLNRGQKSASNAANYTVKQGHQIGRAVRPRRCSSRQHQPIQAAATVTRPPAVTGPVEYYYREPVPWPTDVPLQQHDLQATPYVDLVVAGGGPSGLAVAERVASAGYRVCVIDPHPLGIWPNNYGVWVDEFQAMGLEDCLEVIWPKAKVWLQNDKPGER